MRVEVRDPDYSRRDAGRLAKLEGAISKQRTIKLRLRSISRDKERSGRSTRYALLTDNGHLVRGRRGPRPRGRSARSASPHPRRHQVRDAPRARLPRADRLRHRRCTAAGRRGRSATRSARRGSRCSATRPGGSSAPTAPPDSSRTASSSPSTRPSRSSPRGCCARTAARCRSSRPSCGARSPPRLRRVRERHEGEPPQPAREKPAASATDAVERPAGPVAPERFAVLQALLAYLLAALRRGARGRRSLRRSCSSASPIPAEELEEHLSLLNLVNFGGGCYTVYAELQRRRGARRQGAVGRHVPRGAAPDAARGARDPARARVRRPDDRGRRAHSPRRASARSSRRRSASSSSRSTPEPHVATEEATSSRGSPAACANDGSSRSSTRRRPTRASRRALVEPYSFGGELPNWYVHTWDRTSDGERVVPARPDAERDSLTKDVRAARRASSRRKLRNARTARDPLHQGRRPLGDRARRTAARGRDRAPGAPVRRRRVARERDPRGARRGRPARAGRAAARDRRARQDAGEGARRRAHARARLARGSAHGHSRRHRSDRDPCRTRLRATRAARPGSRRPNVAPG